MKLLRTLARHIDANPDRMVVQACLGCLAVLPLLLVG